MLTLTVLAASLVGSLHCAGMCGPLVAVYSADPGPRWGRGTRALAHAMYNGGRLCAYVGLGAAAGSLGAGLEAAGRLAGLQRIAGPLAGALVVLWGGVALLRILGVSVRAWPAAWTLPGSMRVPLARTARVHPVWRALGLGLLTGALPCGWLWAFVVTAAGAASVAGAVTVMAAFWLGTLPVMLALGFGLQALWRPVRRHVPAACAVAMIVLGLVGVAGRMHALDAQTSRPGAPSVGSDIGQLPSAPAAGHGRR